MPAPERSARRLLGAFYTPLPVARRLARAVLSREPGFTRIVDPACGDGAFLAAARELVPGARLLGIDRDPNACAAARAAGFETLLADALLDALPSGFDALLANPPYLSVKRAPFPADYARELRGRYRTAVGQFDACALFVERSLSLLRPGGRYAILLPRPVLANSEHAPLRRLLFDQAPPELVIDLGEPFAGAAVEAVALVGARAVRPGHVRIEDSGGRCRGELSLEDWSRQPALRLPLRAPPDALALLDRLEARGPALAQATARLSRGLEMGSRDGALEARPRPGTRPVLRGRDVAPFHCAAPTRHLDPAGRPRRVIKDLALYDVPAKVLVRRVADRLAAAVDRSRALALNTLYCLHPAEGVDPDALAALLNSTLATFWWRGRFGADDRLFPYVRVEQLSRLPLPGAPLQSLAHFRSEGSALDAEVARLYGLSATERALLAQPASGGNQNAVTVAP